MHKWTDDECEARNLQYYSTDIHRAAFVLPRFAKKVGIAMLYHMSVSILYSALQTRGIWYEKWLHNSYDLSDWVDNSESCDLTTCQSWWVVGCSLWHCRRDTFLELSSILI